MQSVLAAWISGAVAGLATTAIVMVLLVRRPELAARLPLQVHLVALGIVFANGLVIGLTLLGILVGAVHYRVGGGPGSAFSLGVLAVVGAIAAIYVVVRGRVRSGEAPAVLIGLAIVAVAFGLVTPWLGSMDR